MKPVGKPWGFEIIWAHTDKYVARVLHIDAGKRLSLQIHKQKEETILVISGELELEIQEDQKPKFKHLSPGDFFHIAAGVTHRLKALTEVEVVEVSSELGDVLRIVDDYGRATICGAW